MTQPNGTTSSRERRIGRTVLLIIAGLGLLLTLVATFSSGFAGLLVSIGLTALVLGVGAVIVGRPGWALIGSRKVGAGVLAAGVVLVVGGAAFLPKVDPKVVEPQALLQPLPSTSQSATTETTAPSTTTAVTPTVDSGAVAAAAAAAAESDRLVAEQAAQAAASAKAEAERQASEAAAAAKAQADQAAADAAAKAEADRSAAAAAAQAEADRIASAQAAAQKSQQDAQQKVASPAPSGVSYANCTEAKAAGAAPVLRGQPGYSSKLDRDGDGVGCES